MSPVKVLLALGTLLIALVAPAGAQLVTYDGFSGEALDPARWRGYEHTIRFTDFSGGSLFYSVNDERDDVMPPGSPDGAQNLESRRELAGGAARLMLKTAAESDHHDTDWAQGKGRLGLRVSDAALADHAPAVRAMQARVTVVGAGTETTCAYHYGNGYAKAGIYATLFNDGSSTGPGDRTGDITAAIDVQAAGDGTTVIRARLYRCSEGRCAWIRTVWGAGGNFAARDFATRGREGEPHLLTLRWDEGRRRVFATVTTGTATERVALVYDDTVTPGPPVGYLYDLRVEITPGGCGGPASERDRIVRWIDARFDAVRLATDEAAAGP